MQRTHKNKLDYGAMYFYREFLKKYRSLNVSQATFTLIIKTFFTLVVKKIVTEAYRFHFPGLGLFYLVKRKQNIITDKNGKVRIAGTINWPATKELIKKTGDKTKKVYYLNDHTDRHVYQIHWDKSKMDFVNKRLYTFIRAKSTKQFLNTKIMDSIIPLNAYKLWFQ